MKRLYALRGAVCSENTKEDILKNVGDMCRQLFEQNKVKAEDLVSIQFTQTKELDVMNPCFALRHSDTGIDTSKVALFAMPELEIKGMLKNCIRVLVTLYMEENSKPHMVYINGAEVLRLDFKKKSGQ
ncbi:MAG: chorismate mutase [Treponema sp.]|nr:chorismate mutase [Spirochaetia bacterium]MDD7458576.1 chorismate mutase [Spirochaetales bacterium]MDY5811917.1 chorismate mutase [Treponema sp.]